MVEQDILFGLLRECEVGVKMGVEFIEEVVDKTQSQEFWQGLVESRY